MTVESYTPQATFVAGNTPNIDEADVVVLLSTHNSNENYSAILKIIDTFFEASKDIILLEQSKAKNRNLLLQTEYSRNPHNPSFFNNKTVAGWDHVLSSKWLKIFHQSKDVVDFRESIKTLASMKESTDRNQIINSISTLVRGMQHLEKDPPLPPLEKYENYITKGNCCEKEFQQLLERLINAGHCTLIGLENNFIKQTFSKRQDSLVKEIKKQWESVENQGGKIFIIAGENHGNSESSPFPLEVNKLTDCLSKLCNFTIQKPLIL